MEPKVSVIVPVYNTEKYVKKCIDSILAQTYKNFELILVNDGSTDESGSICDTYSHYDKRVIYYSQENSGASVARNKGIDFATGQYIAFVDSDDRIRKEYLQNLVFYSLKYDADLTACEFTNFFSDSKKKDLRNSFDKNFVLRGGKIKSFLSEKIFDNGSRQRLTNPVCKLYRTDIIKINNIRFSEGIREYEDALFLLQYYQFVSAFVYLHRSLYKREWRIGSLVNSYNPDVIDDMCLTVNKFIEIKNRYSISLKNEDVFIYDIIKNIINKYLFHKNNKESFKEKYRKLYGFINSSPLKEKWESLYLRKLCGKKDRVKLLLIKSHMIFLWNTGCVFKRMIKE